MSGIILTGVDNSATALKAAEKAATLSVALGAELHVVSAFTVNMTQTARSVRSQSDASDMSTVYQQLIVQYAEEAERTASSIAERLRTLFSDLTIVARAVEGAPGAALLREADELNVDLIVVGNKRVQGPTRVLGSIARTVASEAKCDLYIVNTHQR